MDPVTLRFVFIYLGFVVLMVLISLLVIYNFIRYRFQGDKTTLFITIFAVAFVAIIISTLALVRTSTPPSDPPSIDFF